MRVTRVLALTALTTAALVGLSAPASAAPEPCVHVLNPFEPGYTPPTCPVQVVRDLLP